MRTASFWSSRQRDSARSIGLDHGDRPPTALTVAFREPKMARFLRRARLWSISATSMSLRTRDPDPWIFISRRISSSSKPRAFTSSAEVAAEFEKPVMLYSIGKDSAVMLHLALKAFYPGKPPFPLLHVDTTWKFREMIRFRDEQVRRLGLELIVHINEEACVGHQSIHPRFAGAYRRDEDPGAETSAGPLRFRRCLRRRPPRRGALTSQGTGVLVPRPQPPLGPQESASRTVESVQRPGTPGESIRVFPLSNWTELDVWQYIHLENIPIVPLYLAAERPVVERDGTLIMVDDERMPLEPGETPKQEWVRFRTLGCYPLTGAIHSHATTLPEIIQEMLLARHSERQGRLIDHDAAGSMEERSGRGILRCLSSKPISRLTWKPTNARDLLRFITCGSVDDGKSTLIGRLLYDTQLIYEDQLAAVRRDTTKYGTTGEGAGSGPAGRWLAIGARAGHHHRCGLSLFLHRQTQVHHRRHAGPRAVHPQHGHRRFHRAIGHPAGRCPQGRADPDRRHSFIVSCSAFATCCWRSTRWIWSATIRRCSRGFATITWSSWPKTWGQGRALRAGIGCAATTWRNRPPPCPGTKDRLCCKNWSRSRSPPTATCAISVFRCSTSTGLIWIFAVSAAPRRRHGATGRRSRGASRAGAAG